VPGWYKVSDERRLSADLPLWHEITWIWRAIYPVIYWYVRAAAELLFQMTPFLSQSEHGNYCQHTGHKVSVNCCHASYSSTQMPCPTFQKTAKIDVPHGRNDVSHFQSCVQDTHSTMKRVPRENSALATISSLSHPAHPHPPLLCHSPTLLIYHITKTLWRAALDRVGDAFHHWFCPVVCQLSSSAASARADFRKTKNDSFNLYTILICTVDRSQAPNLLVVFPSPCSTTMLGIVKTYQIELIKNQSSYRKLLYDAQNITSQSYLHSEQ